MVFKSMKYLFQQKSLRLNARLREYDFPPLLKFHIGSVRNNRYYCVLGRVWMRIFCLSISESNYTRRRKEEKYNPRQFETSCYQRQD